MRHARAAVRIGRLDGAPTLADSDHSVLEAACRPCRGGVSQVTTARSPATGTEALRPGCCARRLDNGNSFASFVAGRAEAEAVQFTSRTWRVRGPLESAAVKRSDTESGGLVCLPESLCRAGGARQRVAAPAVYFMSISPRSCTGRVTGRDMTDRLVIVSVLVKLADGEICRFVDEVHPSARPGGNRTYYEWVRHTYRVQPDRTLTVLQTTHESWYHFSGEHRDNMRVLRSALVVRYPPSQWLDVEEGPRAGT
jgi:hypothetical protein